ncbi:MAG: hypothetical protein HOG49_24785 [Candidatus Scalindua sp.]|jgi:hypothetical protein|nr:hypothetical protein [Candidatus Scalindua sp.]
MSNLVYIKVFKGYIEARTYGKNNEKKFNSNGLSHPRSLAGNYEEVETAFKKVLSEQPKMLLGLITPNVLIHLIPKMEGGYTSTEIRFFREAAKSGGARKVYLMTDKYPPLEDKDLYETIKAL